MMNTINVGVFLYIVSLILIMLMLEYMDSSNTVFCIIVMYIMITCGSNMCFIFSLDKKMVNIRSDIVREYYIEDNSNGSSKDIDIR